MGDGQNRFLYLWILTKILCSSLGVAFANTNSCDDTEASKCFDSVVLYESISFPLYGHDEQSLDDTCGNIESSFACIKSYYETCHESPECDDNCTDTTKNIAAFLSNTGLEKFTHELCESYNPIRETYLENVDCLMSNADNYARCHNESQASLSYISTIRGPKGVDARCCYSSWYDHCFTSVTEQTCGENATILISYAIHQLVGDMMSKFCAKTNITCTSAPFPPEVDEEPDEYENEITPKNTNSAMLQLSAAGVIILSYFSIVLSTHIL